MSESFFSRDSVAQHFAVAPRILLRYEARGFVRTVRLGNEEGYGPEEVRRLWTVLSLQRDLGINLAGVEAILKLRVHLDDLHHRVATLAESLREALEADLEPDSDA